jgi:hypothetical protein
MDYWITAAERDLPSQGIDVEEQQAPQSPKVCFFTDMVASVDSC